MSCPHCDKRVLKIEGEITEQRIHVRRFWHKDHTSCAEVKTYEFKVPQVVERQFFKEDKSA